MKKIIFIFLLFVIQLMTTGCNLEQLAAALTPTSFLEWTSSSDERFRVKIYESDGGVQDFTISRTQFLKQTPVLSGRTRIEVFCESILNFPIQRWDGELTKTNKVTLRIIGGTPWPSVEIFVQDRPR